MGGSENVPSSSHAFVYSSHSLFKPLSSQAPRLNLPCAHSPHLKFHRSCIVPSDRTRSSCHDSLVIIYNAFLHSLPMPAQSSHDSHLCQNPSLLSVSGRQLWLAPRTSFLAWRCPEPQSSGYARLVWLCPRLLVSRQLLPSSEQATRCRTTRSLQCIVAFIAHA